jgi:hypothetical protein
VGLPVDTPELVLAKKLAEYTDLLERRPAKSSNRVKAAGKLVTIALRKRPLSSIEAFEGRPASPWVKGMQRRGVRATSVWNRSAWARRAQLA